MATAENAVLVVRVRWWEYATLERLNADPLWSATLAGYHGA